MSRKAATVLAVLAAAVVAAAVASAAGSAARRPRLEAPRGLAAASSPVLRDGSLGARGAHLLASTAWNGGSYRTSTGEAVTVHLSPAYADDDGVAQRWADFFASLVHGPELGLLTAYFAPPDEVRALCGGGEGVLGCYEDDRLVAIGEESDGISPESVAAHEYGHHVAFNRVNPPWTAIDWGTKRWATAERVCPRVAGGTAFPGDEGDEYTLDPGEAFAESFRVLNETRAGEPETWPLLDASFVPDSAALQAVEADVLTPWTGPTTSTIRARFATGRRSWTTRVPTPLDGTVSVTLGSGSNGLEVLAPDGRTVLSAGTWTQQGGRQAEASVCGSRSVVVRVTRGGRPSAFSLRIVRP